MDMIKQMNMKRKETTPTKEIEVESNAQQGPTQQPQKSQTDL